MRLQDVDKLDPKYSEILVLINGNHTPIQFNDSTLNGVMYTLHPIQQNSADLVVRDAKFESTNGTFTVPVISTAVFVVEKPALQISQPAILALGGLGVVLVAGLVYFLTRKPRQKSQPNK